MKLRCPDCDHPIRADDINIRLLVAKCSACSAVFSFEPPSRAQTAPTIQKSDLNLALPKGMSLSQDNGRLKIIRRWFTWTALPLLGFAAIWDAFLVFWYSLAFGQEGSASMIMTLFPLIHVGVGVYITYFSVSKLINRTIITVDDEVLKIVHTPLPWPGKKSVYISAIRQFYVHRVEKHNRKSGQMVESFSVFALLGDQGTIPIVEGLSSKAQALYLEQELERRLNIAPEPVAGEYVPPAHELRELRVNPTGVSLSLPQDEQTEVSLPDAD